MSIKVLSTIKAFERNRACIFINYAHLGFKPFVSVKSLEIKLLIGKLNIQSIGNQQELSPQAVSGRKEWQRLRCLKQDRQLFKKHRPHTQLPLQEKKSLEYIDTVQTQLERAKACLLTGDQP